MRNRPLGSIRSNLVWGVLSITVFMRVGLAAPDKVHLESVRQLVRLTNVEDTLRTDTEQAARLTDALPTDLPMDLRSQIRKILDQRLSYTSLESELVTSAAGRLDTGTVDRMLKWHSSAVGQVLSQAESSAYASLFDLSTFALHHTRPPKPTVIDDKLVAQVIAQDHFLEFIGNLTQESASARARLRTLLCLDTCNEQVTGEAAQPGGRSPQQLGDSIRDALSSVPPPDLHAYLTFLRDDRASNAEVALQSALVELEQRAWQGVVSDIQAAFDHYAESLGGAAFQRNLEQATLQIDRAEDLAGARFMLLQLQRVSPVEPAVLTQLARVTLKLAPTAVHDIQPSVPSIDATALNKAQAYLDEALAIAPDRAETLRLRGHLAYLQRQFGRSIELLRQASSHGDDNPWLAINLGDAEWAMSYEAPHTSGPNRELMQQAADEFERALRRPLPQAAKERALHQLTAIYPTMGNIQRADALHHQYIAMQKGAYARAWALERYSTFRLLAARDPDGAVIAAAAALNLQDSTVYKSWLAETLLVRGGRFLADGDKAKSTADFTAAAHLHVDLESLFPEMARLPGTLPGVFSMHEAGVVKDFSGSLGGNALVAASLYATKEQIEKLLSWGANPNYFSAGQGAPLHYAIMGDNIEGVKVLLAHGADPTLPFVDGRLPSQLRGDATDVKRSEILRLIEEASRGHATSTSMAPGPPFTANHKYRLKKPLDGLPANWVFVYVNVCRWDGDDTLGCYSVHDPNSPPGSLFSFALDQAQIDASQEWFEDLGPTAAEKPSPHH